MKKKKKQYKHKAVLALLTDVNLKNLYLFFVTRPFDCIISNFEKSTVPLLTKDFFSRSFPSCKFFSRKGKLCKKWNLKTI